jgi:hypothetical protein
MSIPVFLHSYQHMLSSDDELDVEVMVTVMEMVMIATQVDVKWYLIVVLNCMYLLANDIKHFFLCGLATCIFYLDQYLF